METNKYVFTNVNKLAGYIKNQLINPTPLKIQMSLYFLWAFYAATFGNLSANRDEDEEFGLQPPYPKWLFKPDFAAGRYGPIINSVHIDLKNNKIVDLDDDVLKDEMNFDDQDKQNELNRKEIILFINNMLDQVNDVNDFGLVQRSHQDSAWKNAYKEGVQSRKMNSQNIKEDYINYSRNY